MATFKRPKSRVPNPQASTRSLATIKRKRKGKYGSSQVTLGFRLLSVVPYVAARKYTTRGWLSSSSQSSEFAEQESEGDPETVAAIEREYQGNHGPQ